MVSRVALVKTDKGLSKAYRHALNLIGDIDDLNVEDRDVTIKVGIFDPRNLNYPTIQAVRAVVNAFTRSKNIFLVESDSSQGKALDRLQVWEEVFSDRIVPFDLTRDPHVCEGVVCGERIQFSHVLFKPNIFVSLHVPRKGSAGSIFKNLLGLIPDTRKDRFHDRLGVALVDIAEAVGWIDLAVIDSTYVYSGEWKVGEPLLRERKDLLVVGRDPVAVETVGSILAGINPLSIPSMIVAKDRKLGEVNISKIEVLGESLKNV